MTRKDLYWQFIDSSDGFVLTDLPDENFSACEINSKQGQAVLKSLDVKRLRRQIEDRLRKGTDEDILRTAILLRLPVISNP